MRKAGTPDNRNVDENSWQARKQIHLGCSIEVQSPLLPSSCSSCRSVGPFTKELCWSRSVTNIQENNKNLKYSSISLAIFSSPMSSRLRAVKSGTWKPIFEIFVFEPWSRVEHRNHCLRMRYLFWNLGPTCVVSLLKTTELRLPHL